LTWLIAFIEKLDLKRITLVAQDWGGILGLRLLASHSERFARAVLANTFLPTGSEDLGPAFFAWRDLSQKVSELNCGRVIQGATTTHLSREVEYAYNAPFPNEDYLAGAREFPMLVPTSPNAPGAADNRAAWTVLEQLEIPILLAFSDSDPVKRSAEPLLRERLRGAHDRQHVTIEGGGHFLQEDRGPELSHAVLDFIERENP
jgi:haloalkane dehalogenase